MAALMLFAGAQVMEHHPLITQAGVQLKPAILSETAAEIAVQLRGICGLVLHGHWRGGLLQLRGGADGSAESDDEGAAKAAGPVSVAKVEAVVLNLLRSPAS